MKKTSIIAAFALSCVITSELLAEPLKGFYAGPRLNRVFIDDLSGSEEELGYGLGVGYSFGNISLEYEYARYNASIEGFFRSDTDVEIDTNAFYFAARTSGNTFLKFKAGYLDEDISVDGGVDESDSGASYGIGLGFQNDAGVIFTIDLTQVEDEVRALSLRLDIIPQ